MNREDIIRLMNEAAETIDHTNLLPFFERFAALVAAHEREACAKLFDGEVWCYDYREIAALIRKRGDA